LASGRSATVAASHPGRSRARAKRVLEEHTIAQHERTGGWSTDVQLDTTDLSVERTLEIINHRLSALDST
jgi:hypothetical protein